MASADCEQKQQPLTLELTSDVTDVHVSSSGNMSFEVPLPSPRSPCVKSPLANKKMHSPRREVSQEEIANKLKAAEERKTAQDQAKRDQAAAEQDKIDAAVARRDELETNFKQNAERDIENKLETNKENREKVIAARTEKAKMESEKARLVREQREAHLEAVINELANKVEETQLHAKELREHKYEELQERLQKEFDRIEAARVMMGRQEGDARDEWKAHIEQAAARRDLILEQLKHKQHDMEEHAELVRARKGGVLGELNRSGDGTRQAAGADNNRCRLQ